MVGEHSEREGAAELRARQLARDAGHGAEYAGVDDYGVLGDQIETDDTPTVTPDPAAGWHPEFFDGAVESVSRWENDLFESAAADALGRGEDWYSDAAAHAGVAHPGEQVVDDLVADQLRDHSELIEQAPLPDAGGLTLALDKHISPDWALSVDESHLAPTTLQTLLFEQDSVTATLIDALRTLAADCPPDTDLVTHLIENGVTALDGAYARLAAAGLSDLEAGDDSRLWTFIAVTRSLGGQTELNLRSTLDDIRDGPIALLGAADETPTVEFDIDREFLECKSTRRRRFLTHLQRLTPGVDVRITGSRLTLRQFIDRHGDELPASVSEDAQQRLRRRDTASTITEQRARRAEDAVATLQRDDPAWDVLASLLRSQTEYRSYSDLYEDNRSSASESGIRRQIKRLRDVGLVESRYIDREKHVSSTLVGRIALDKHPDHSDLESDEDRRRSSSSSPGGWSTEHTEQAESPDSTPARTSVSDPRNYPASTVYPNRAREGGDRRVATDPTEGGSPHSPSSSGSSAGLSTRFLSLSEHHAVASAASNGHISLLDRDLGEQAISRDHRETGFSYDADRDEVVVQVDFSPSIALTAARLCAALLSDPAFDQVLTPERLAGHPDGMSLDGLAVSSPYLLRSGACIGWLKDMDATANAFTARLKNAKRDLLSMTGELRGESGQIDGDTAQSLLRKAHGLMGVALRLYDLLDVDVVRELQFPHGLPNEDESRRELWKFLEKASSIGGRYGLYSAERVLHEECEEKREQLVSEPSVDSHDPEGTLLGSWVLTGEGATDLAEWLSRSSSTLTLQEEGVNFAPFELRGPVVDGNRRQAVAEVVTRVLSFKEGLRPDRQAISMLAALSSDVSAAAEAVSVLGGEDEPRAIDMQDVRYGLSQLSHRQIVPDLGNNVISKVVRALLDAQEWVSTAELADLAGCSKRSLSTDSNERVFTELEVAGLLEREDQGAGKATLWRLQIPFRRERHDNEPLPEMLVESESESMTGNWRLSDAVFEVFVTASDDCGVEYRFEFGTELTMTAFADRDLRPLLSAYPELQPTVGLIATLLDQCNRVRSDLGEIYLGKHPDPQQSTLDALVSPSPS